VAAACGRIPSFLDRAPELAVPLIDIAGSLSHTPFPAMPNSVTLDRMLHALADPTRRRILQALKQKGACSLDKTEGLCACDIQDRVRLTQPTISHHMSILKKAGLVEAKKEGQWMWYRRNESALRDLARSVRESV
jgi:ArsR family transcriptional regulator